MSKTEITLTLSFRPQGWQLDGIYQSVWKWCEKRLCHKLLTCLYEIMIIMLTYINWWWLMHPFDHNETVKYQR